MDSYQNCDEIKYYNHGTMGDEPCRDLCNPGGDNMKQCEQPDMCKGIFIPINFEWIFSVNVICFL